MGLFVSPDWPGTSQSEGNSSGSNSRVRNSFYGVWSEIISLKKKNVWEELWNIRQQAQKFLILIWTVTLQEGKNVVIYCEEAQGIPFP